MKILFFCPIFPLPLHHANKIRFYNLLKYLSFRHEVTFVSFIPSQGDLRYQSQFEELGCKVRLIVHQPFDVKPEPASPLPEMAQRYYTHRAAMELEELCGSEDFDIAQMEYILFSGPYLPHIKSNGSPICTVITLHDVDSLEERDRLGLLPQGLRAEKLHDLQRVISYEKRMLPQFDQLIVITKKDRDSLEMICPGLNVSVIPTGTDIEYFSPNGYLPTAKVIGFTGVIGHRPNLEGLKRFYKDIYPLIKRDEPDVRLLIIGKEPPAEIKGWEKVDPSITITGMVEDIRPYERQCMLSVVPVSAPSGLRTKMLNTMAMAIPVVATSNACEGIDVTSGKDCLVADKDEEFAQCVIRLIRDRSLRERIGLEARRLMEDKYSWSIIGRRLEEIYEGLRNR